MSGEASQTTWKVKITLQAAGPIRRRTKHKSHKLLRAEASISLPFVPYPGLYLTFSKPRTRGEPLTLYLRIRTVEWNIAECEFECVVDEMHGSLQFSETYEVRGPVRIEEHFTSLQKTLHAFGFDLIPDADGLMALDKCPNGTKIDQM